MNRLFKISPDATGQETLKLMPGSYDGSVMAMRSVTEPGEYFLIKTFKIEHDANNSTAENSNGSEETAKAAPAHGVEGSHTESQQTLQGGHVGQAGSSKESSSKKKTSKESSSKTASSKAASSKSAKK